LALFFLLAAGCASVEDLGSYDPAVPPAGQSILEIGPAFSVVGFDGAELLWEAGPGQSRVKKAVIRIPAGRHELLVNFYFQDNQVRERLTRVKVKGDFAPGGVYRLERRKDEEQGPYIVIAGGP
jgi:hypothetical protein